MNNILKLNLSLDKNKRRPISFFTNNQSRAKIKK